MPLATTAHTQSQADGADSILVGGIRAQTGFQDLLPHTFRAFRVLRTTHLIVTRITSIIQTVRTTNSSGTTLKLVPQCSPGIQTW